MCTDKIRCTGQVVVFERRRMFVMVTKQIKANKLVGVNVICDLILVALMAN